MDHNYEHPNLGRHLLVFTTKRVWFLCKNNFIQRRGLKFSGIKNSLRIVPASRNIMNKCKGIEAQISANRALAEILLALEK